MIRNQYANDNTQIYSISIHKLISRDTQSYTQYSNSIHTNMHIYANGIYAQIRRIYANVLRSQYAWYAINTQMIYADIRNCNMQYAYIRNLRNTVILYAPIRVFTQMVYTHRYAGYTQMIYAFNTHDTQSIRNQYAINTQWYAIAIRKSIRIHTHVYAIHIRNSQYAIAQNVNTHDTQIPFSIRIHTHPYAVGSLLMSCPPQDPSN